MEENGGSAKLIIGGLLALMLLVLTPVIIFMGANDDPPVDPNGQCVIQGEPAGDAEKPQVSIPEQYREAVEAAAKTAGLPVGIIAAQIQQESQWNPKAQSPVGAAGLTQFMPGTWATWGNGKDVFDPFAAIDAQGRYMKHLADFVADMATNDNEKVKLTLAAYNAGPGNVQKYGGIPPFAETEEYVEKIMKNAQLEYSSTCEAPGGFDFGDLQAGEWAHPLPASRLTSGFGSRPCP